MQEAPKLSFVHRQAEDVLVLEVAGDLALDGSRLMRQEIHSLLEAGHRKILLNMARVRYLDSTGTGLLVAAKTSAINRNVQLRLCCVPPDMAQLLTRLQLNKILEVYEEETEALESFR